jgi:hypothetical protein
MRGALRIIFSIAFGLTYIISFYRWWNTDYGPFIRETLYLVWALCPILNFIYVWDVWWETILLVVGVFLYLPQ